MELDLIIRVVAIIIFIIRAHIVNVHHPTVRCVHMVINGRRRELFSTGKAEMSLAIFACDMVTLKRVVSVYALGDGRALLTPEIFST